MERHVNYIFVGAFISLITLAFVVFLVWLVGSYDNRVYDRYTVLFTGAISGLTEGGKVHYLGVEVGRVIDIRLDGERTDLIKVDIEIDQRTPVREKTQAVLKPQGITGLSFIELTTADADTKPAVKVNGERYPIIIGSGSQLEKLFATLPEISNKLINIAERIEVVLSQENTEKIGSIIHNIDQLSGKLDQAIDPTFANLNDTLKGVQTTVKSAENLIGGATTTVNSFGQDIARAGKAIDNVIAFTGRINKLTERNEKSVDRFLGQGLSEITLLARDSRAAVQNVDRLTGNLADRPSRLIYQPPFKGFVIPKE